ncbi:MAG: helix-turn-helix transcriptional regulator [Oxalobacter sp.]|nr:helix-turn-helix transcriptional regulator [Oxalobacter sp.]
MASQKDKTYSLQEPVFCPVETTIGLIGGKYKPLILWKLAGRTLRFSQLQKEISAATPKMLTQQLRELEQVGLVNRKVFPVVPPKVEYSLTELGKSIYPVLEAMYRWGTGYLQGKGHTVNCTMHPPASTAGDSCCCSGEPLVG